MCDLTTAGLLMTAMSGAMKVAEHAQQSNVAKQQRADIDAAEARASAQTQVQQLEMSEDASQQISERVRSNLIERGRLRVAAGESGVSGVSQDRVLRDSEGAAERDIAAIQANRGRSLRASGQNLSDAKAGYKAQRRSIRKPSALNTGLSIAGNYMSRRSEEKQAAS